MNACKNYTCQSPCCCISDSEDESVIDRKWCDSPQALECIGSQINDLELDQLRSVQNNNASNEKNYIPVFYYPPKYTPQINLIPGACTDYLPIGSLAVKCSKNYQIQNEKQVNSNLSCENQIRLDNLELPFEKPNCDLSSKSIKEIKQERSLEVAKEVEELDHQILSEDAVQCFSCSILNLDPIVSSNSKNDYQDYKSAFDEIGKSRCIIGKVSNKRNLKKIKKEQDNIEMSNDSNLLRNGKDTCRRSDDQIENATENYSSNTRGKRTKYNMISKDEKAKALLLANKYGINSFKKSKEMDGCRLCKKERRRQEDKRSKYGDIEVYNWYLSCIKNKICVTAKMIKDKAIEYSNCDDFFLHRKDGLISSKLDIASI